jgi:hypothetical protein
MSWLTGTMYSNIEKVLGKAHKDNNNFEQTLVPID